MRQYILYNNPGFETVDENTYLSLMGTPDIRVYATRVYRGLMVPGEVPEEYRETVTAIVSNKISKWGTYDSRNISVCELRKLIEDTLRSAMARGTVKELFRALLDLRENAPDALASRAVSAYPLMKSDGSLIKAGTRINWNGVLKRAAVDLWDTAENNPDNAPDAWEDIAYKDGYRIIPAEITAGIAFSPGEYGWWNGSLYESLLESNVWTPEQNPAGWKKMD